IEQAPAADPGIDPLAGREWRQSRIPALDALVHFIPDGPRDAAVDAFARSQRSRWYSRQGGTRVVVSMEREPESDATTWQVETGAWDQEDGDGCGETIRAMTVCWVTKHNPYVLLCDECHAEVADRPRKRPVDS